MVRSMAKGLSVRAQIHARSSRNFSDVRAFEDGIEPRTPASAPATIISLFEIRNIGAVAKG